jgi:polyhydroxyalkanoate synthase
MVRPKTGGVSYSGCMNRTGPSPLALHLSLAATAAGGDRDLLAAYMAGIRQYQNSDYARTLPGLPVVWSAGTVTLRHAAAAPGGGNAPPLLMVPSMINRSTILDIAEDVSFVRWMAARGRDVYLMDWGEPKNDPAQAQLDTLMAERLIPAIRHAAAAGGHGVVDALGYCMGGTLLAGAAGRNVPVRRLVFLAAPWDFDAGDRLLQAQVLSFAASGQTLMALHDRLPASWVQTVFATLDPAQLLHKYVRFAAMAPDSAEARRFVAVEDWLNDAVDLPSGIARMCIHDWYAGNKTAAGSWRVGGHPVMLRDINCPALILCAKKDRLVPPESARAMEGLLPYAKIHMAETGHIGLLAGGRAADHVWRPVLDFLSA